MGQGFDRGWPRRRRPRDARPPPRYRTLPPRVLVTVFLGCFSTVVGLAALQVVVLAVFAVGSLVQGEWRWAALAAIGTFAALVVFLLLAWLNRRLVAFWIDEQPIGPPRPPR